MNLSFVMLQFMERLLELHIYDKFSCHYSAVNIMTVMSIINETDWPDYPRHPYFACLLIACNQWMVWVTGDLCSDLKICSVDQYTCEQDLNYSLRKLKCLLVKNWFTSINWTQLEGCSIFYIYDFSLCIYMYTLLNFTALIPTNSFLC